MLNYDPSKKQVFRVFEIDNNNSKGNMKSEHIEYNLFKVNKQKEAIFDVSFSSEEENTINIVDVGGSDDMKTVIDSLYKSGLENVEFFIPTSKDDEQFDNVKDTINIIIAKYPKAEITLVFNYRHSENPSVETIKEEFPNFFGKEVWGLKENYSKIGENINALASVPQTDIFLALKNEFQTTLLDTYINAQEMIKNERKLRADWRKQGREHFIKEMDKMDFVKDIDIFVKEVKKGFGQ